MKRNFFYYAALVSMLSALMLVTSCEDNTKPEPAPEQESVLSGDITENVTLKSGSTYELQGAYTVKEGATLTIEPGVNIIAKKGATVSFILVQQGGKINAQGTADSPIVMTSDVKEHGAWGGIHICGKAKTNVSDGISEVGDSPYGGSDDSDNSGSLKYVRVEYAGYLYSEDKECNGFTFYGVGNGTVLENLEAYKGSDDGYEWFGGCVNAKNLISIDNLDDSFDWTYGFRGRIDGAYAKHLSNECDHLMEGDNNKSDNAKAPVSHPTFKNVVLVGIDRDGGNRGIRIRRGSELTLENAEVAGKTNSLDLQSEATKAYFTKNAATALVKVKISGAIVDAEDNAPLAASIFSGLTVDSKLNPAVPAWVAGDWILIK